MRCERCQHQNKFTSIRKVGTCGGEVEWALHCEKCGRVYTFYLPRSPSDERLSKYLADDHKDD